VPPNVSNPLRKAADQRSHNHEARTQNPILDPDDHRPDNHVRLWRKWKLRQRQGYRQPDRQRQIEGMGPCDEQNHSIDCWRGSLLFFSSQLRVAGSFTLEQGSYGPAFSPQRPGTVADSGRGGGQDRRDRQDSL